MIHENKDEFIKTLGRASKKKGFLLPLIEKDYYLTLILSRIYELSEILFLKEELALIRFTMCIIV